MAEDNRASFTVAIVGRESGQPYNGDFEVKTLMSRRDHFLADERRRQVIGTNPDGVAPSLQAEAYMIGQLLVRITKAPEWWTSSNGGVDLPDANVTTDVFELALAKEQERKSKVVGQADKAKESLRKQPAKE